MKKGKKKRKVPPLVILILILLVLFTIQYFTVWSVDTPSEVDTSFPECYIAKEENCAEGYKGMGQFSPSELIHCCKPPHYLLQGIYQDVAGYMIFESGHANQLYIQYNCSFDIERKLYCTDINDCMKRPNLKGCHKADCNWCCGNTCTLMGCGSSNITLSDIDFRNLNQV